MDEKKSFCWEKIKNPQMFRNARICKVILRTFFERVSANTFVKNSHYFLEYSTILLSIFPSQPVIILLRNHPYQAFLVSKKYTSIHEEEKSYTFSHMSVKPYEGGG